MFGDDNDAGREYTALIGFVILVIFLLASVF